MIYYITSWEEKDGKFLPIYQPENKTGEELKDDEFKFVGELNTPEFKKHFDDNIVINSTSNICTAN